MLDVSYVGMRLFFSPEECYKLVKDANNIAEWEIKKRGSHESLF